MKALTERSGISQPAVSKHLGLLKDAGLVHASPDGRKTQYRARAEALVPLRDWTNEMARFWEARFDALEDPLKRMD